MKDKISEQLFKTLQDFVPKDAQATFSEATGKVLEETVAELEADYDSKLNKLKEEYELKLKETEETGYAGYTQALEIIDFLRGKLARQNEEFQEATKKEYKVAFDMIMEERSKREALEVELSEDFENRYEQVKEWIVDQFDEFYENEVKQVRESVKRELLNDPSLMEQKVAFDKILDIAANYLSDEDYSVATNSKLENLQRQLEDVKKKHQYLESKNVKLSLENRELTETVQKSKKLLTETVEKVDRKVRAEKASKAEGRGNPNMDKPVKIINEEAYHANGSKETNKKPSDVNQIINDWRILAGIEGDYSEQSEN